MPADGVRVAVADLGTNSTRLLIADVAGGEAVAVERRSEVTRLGDRLEATGRLDDAAIARVLAVLSAYRRIADQAGAAAFVGVLTSAVRDAANGAELTKTVRERFGIAAHVISGADEARLTFRGAVAGRELRGPTAVIDVGGGSTELVVGDERGQLLLRASAQVGVVRHSERHLHADPPTRGELLALREDAAAALREAVRSAAPRFAGPCSNAEHGAGQLALGIAVAGTPLQAAAILGTRRLERAALTEVLDRLAAMPLAERREVPGLDRARAPVMVAGLAILLEAMAVLGLEAVEASDRDILFGAALQHTGFLGQAPQFCA